MRLIDADAFIWWVDDYYDCTELGQIVIEWINDRPTIEPKRGRWVQIEEDNDDIFLAYWCTKCRRTIYVDADGRFVIGLTIRDMHYCPNCGARMEASDD